VTSLTDASTLTQARLAVNGFRIGRARCLISSTFYEKLFLQKCFAQFFLFGFEIFWQKNIGEKAVGKMWMKLTTGQPHFPDLREPIKVALNIIS
jgi:hypothetical protein